MSFFEKHYPGVYIFLLNHFNQKDQVKKYMEECKAYEEDKENFDIYI